MTSFYIDFAELSDAIESYENLIEKLETYNSSLIITTETINYGPALENMVYLYARGMNYSVSVGRIGNLLVCTHDHSLDRIIKIMPTIQFNELLTFLENSLKSTSIFYKF